MTLRLLDLFCGVGGAAMGYHRAGFEVVGVDHRPQRHYPFAFVQADAFEYLADLLLTDDPHGWFDAIHASPPCQRFSRVTRTSGDPKHHPDLIADTRAWLAAIGLPYVIENVPGAPLVDPVVLCGSSFGLLVRRHRLFEVTFPLLVPSCVHHVEAGRDLVANRGDARTAGRRGGVVTITGKDVRARGWRTVAGKGGAALWNEAMGIDWASTRELRHAIPPAYTELIGHQLAQTLRQGAS